MSDTLHLGLAAGRIWLLTQLDLKKHTDLILLPPNQMRTLEYICMHPDCSQNDVAAAIHVSPAAIAQNMKKLCGMGYVERIACPGNLRANSLRVTDNGILAAQACTKILKAEEAKLTNGFTEAEREQLWDYLKRIIKNLEDSTTDSLGLPELAMLIMSKDSEAKKDMKGHDPSKEVSE